MSRFDRDRFRSHETKNAGSASSLSGCPMTPALPMTLPARTAQLKQRPRAVSSPKIPLGGCRSEKRDGHAGGAVQMQ